MICLKKERKIRGGVLSFKKYLDRYDGPLQLQECYDECELESSEIIFHRLKKEYEKK